MSKKEKNRKKRQAKYSHGEQKQNDDGTQFFLFLKHNWSTENFLRMQERERRHAESRTGNRWKGSRGADRDPEREERERLQLLEDYLPFDEE